MKRSLDAREQEIEAILQKYISYNQAPVPEVIPKFQAIGFNRIRATNKENAASRVRSEDKPLKISERYASNRKSQLGDALSDAR